MKIIKRNGAEVGFDITKIIIAITKANESVEEVDRMTPVQIQRIAESVELQCQKMNRAPTVEEIQDMVEHYIMAHGAFEVAKLWGFSMSVPVMTVPFCSISSRFTRSQLCMCWA